MSALQWPLPLDLLRSIGQSVLPDRGAGRPHKGVDLRADAGTPVLSAAPGRVLRVEDGRMSPAGSGRARAGLWVDVLGEDGRVYRYLHLGTARVQAGDTLAAGTPLGATAPAGTSGIDRNTAPHLHFEIREGDYDPKRPKWHSKPRGELGDYGTPLDPLKLLPLQSHVRPGTVEAQPARNGFFDAAAAARGFLTGSPAPATRGSVLGRVAAGAIGVLAVAAITRMVWPGERSASSGA